VLLSKVFNDIFHKIEPQVQKSWFFLLEPVQKVILIIVCLLLVGGLLKAGYYTIHYGGTDLRVGVVAARMLDSGKTVYFYKWSPGDDKRLLNPKVNRDGAVNGLTVAPGGLYLMSLFAFLNYPMLRIVWGIFQYLLSIYIFCFFLFQSKTTAKDKFYIIAIGGLFFLCSHIWFIHIERGQIYIFYAFLFCLIYQFYTSNNKWANYLAGVIVAVAVYCHPVFIVLLIPLFLAFNRWTILGLITCFIPLILHAFFHMELWKGYLTAMTYYTGFGPVTSLPIGQTNFHYPDITEGAENLTLFKHDFICGGITPLDMRINLFSKVTSSYFYIFLYIIVVTILTISFKKRLHRKNPVGIILFGFLIYMIAEYIMPAPRGAYHLVQWILPVLVFLHKPQFSSLSFVLLVTGLCFTNAFPFYLPFIFDIGELLLVYCLMTYIWNAKKMNET
jgi:hypothetical protein